MKAKRLLAAVLGMTMAFSVTAFAANDADAVSVYQQMEAKTQTMTDIDAFYDFDIRMTDGTDTISARLEMNMKANHFNMPQQMKFMAYMRLTPQEGFGGGSGPNASSYNGAPLEGSMYFGDGFMYMDFLGTKMKSAVDMSGMDGLTSTMGINSLDYIDNLQLRMDGENRILSYTMNADKMNQLLGQVMNTLGMTQDMNGVTVKYREISGEYVVNPEGYYTNATMNLTMEMSDGSDTITITMNGKIGVANPGQPVEIAMPNPADYISID